MERLIQSEDDFGELRVLKPPSAHRVRRKEGGVVAEIVRNLEKMGYKPVKNHGSRYAQRGRPDIEVLIKIEPLPYAVPVYIEVKRDGSAERRKQQEARIEQKLKEGAVAFFASSWEEVVEQLREATTRVDKYIKGLWGVSSE